jgi:hypothetical protein
MSAPTPISASATSAAIQIGMPVNGSFPVSSGTALGGRCEPRATVVVPGTEVVPGAVVAGGLLLEPAADVVVGP